MDLEGAFSSDIHRNQEAIEYKEAAPLDMLIFCPKCGKQHIDRPETHNLYENGDRHIPSSITDTNGDVVLGLCKICNKAEVELDGPCWDNSPHKSHQCHGCGMIFRIADVFTNGVAAIKTRGGNDTWPEKEGLVVKEQVADLTIAK